MNLHKITFILLVIGGLNWLLEAFSYGLANWIPMGVMQVVYVLVGLSALYEIFTHKNNCNFCTTKPM